MQEKQLEKYAFYKIDEKEHYQYLPTGKLQDVIFEAGMEYVSEVGFFRDGESLIKIVENPDKVGIGTAFSVSEIIKRYYEKDPLFKKYDEEDIIFLKKYSADKLFFLSGDGELYFQKYKEYLKPNYEGKIKNIKPDNVIDGSLHWYLELHNGEKVSYEATLYDDKKYRGQECDYYSFVRVAEYEIDGKAKIVIIGRDDNKYAYQSVQLTEIDDIIDGAKGLISHQQEFTGFAGVSPLYSFNTEDSACVFRDREEKIDGGVTVTVTGSGDAILDLFLYGADKVIAFDTNSMTKFQAELKFIAAKVLDFEEFKELFSNFNGFKEDIFRKVERYLSEDCKKVWNELLEYSKLFYDKPLKDAENGGLFYPTASIFSSNSTINNPNGYFNEDNYLKLHEILKEKNLSDISFYNCDLFDLPMMADISEADYVYLSNIMDFIVGIDKNKIDKDAMEKFKGFILNELLPKVKSDAIIDLSYIKAGWHMYVDDSPYAEIYTANEGFSMNELSSGKDKVLTFDSESYKKSNVRG